MDHEGLRHPEKGNGGEYTLNTGWQLFEPFFNRLDEAVVVLDSDRKICFLNHIALSFYPPDMQWSGMEFVFEYGVGQPYQRDYFIQPGDGVAVSMKTFSMRWEYEQFYLVLARRQPLADGMLQGDSILDHSNVSFFRCCIDGRLQYASKGVANLLGYPDIFRLSQLSIHDLIVYSGDETRKIRRKLVDEGKLQNEVIEVRCFDGASKWLECSIIAVKDPDDHHLLFYEGTLQELSSRTKNDMVLQETELRLHTISDQTLDGIIMLGNDKSIIVWNRATEEITGLSKEIVLNRQYSDVMTQLQAEVTEYNSSEPQPGNLNQNENYTHNRFISQIGYKIRRFDGSERYIETIPFPVREGSTRLLGVFLRDITERLKAEAQLKRQVEELSVLNDVAKAGSEATDEEQLIEYVTRRVGDMVFPDTFGMMMVDASREYLFGHYSSRSDENEEQKDWKIPLGIGIAGNVALTGKSRCVGDVTLDRDYIIINPETRTELCVPMISDGVVLGVLNLESSKYHAFNRGDENLLNAIARQLSTAITKTRLVEAERRRRFEAEALSRASYSLVSSFELKDSLDSYLDCLMQVIQCDQSMMMVKEGEDIVRIVAFKGNNGFSPQIGKKMGIDNRMFQVIKGATESMVLSDFPNEMKEIDSGRLKHHPVALVVPLLVRGNILGYLSLARKGEPGFTERDVTLAETFANHAAVAIENANLFDDTRRRAEEMEALTGVSMALRSAETALDMIPILVSKVVELFKVPAVSFFLLERDVLELVGAFGPAEHYMKSCFPFIEDEIYWKTVYSGEALVNMHDADRDRLSNSYIFNMIMGENSNMLGGAIVPLKSTDSVVGLLHIILPNDRYFSAEESRLLFAVAEIAANALNRANIMETLEQRVSLRISQLSTLYMVSSIASEHLPLSELLSRMLGTLLDSLESSVGMILLLGDCNENLNMAVQVGVPEQNWDFISKLPIKGEFWDWTHWLFQEPEPLVTSDILSDERLPNDLYIEGKPSVIATPIRSHRRTLGLMLVMGATLESFSAEDLGLLSVISEQIGSTIENDNLKKQAEEVAVMEERQRLARELHDSVTQALYSVFLMANGARKLAKSDKIERCMHYLDELSQTAEEALKEMRLLIYQLRPAALEQEGLREALRQRLEAVERRAGMCINLQGELPYKLSIDVEEGIYRIVMEALNNILKHSGATTVNVTIRAEGQNTCIEIVDNGRGFDTGSNLAKSGIGLNSMRERAEKLGGSLSIDSVEGKGTLVKIVV